MIIGIDTSMLVYKGSGVANYTYNLIKSLLSFDKENKYKIFYSSFRKPVSVQKKLKEFENFGAKVYIYPFPPRVLKFLWNKHHLLPVEWLIGKVDCFHSSDFLRPPLSKKTRGITTIHDLTWKIFPQYHTEDIIEAHQRKIIKTIRYGDIVVTDSQNTKNDLLKYYPQFSKQKINVIPLGIDNKFKPIADHKKIKQALKKYKLDYPRDYLLYVGAIEPRKNLEFSVKIFAKLIKNKKFKDYKFLLVGRAGWKNKNLFKLIEKLNISEKVIFVGYVSDKDLVYFYNAAKLTVYLSKYEGFGLPPLESLFCDTPVTAGKNSSLKEILPKQFLVSLDDKKIILDKIISLLEIEKPVKIKELLKYSWQNYAKNFIKIYF